MRTLNEREYRLVWGLAISLFVAVNLAILPAMTRWNRRLVSEEKLLQSQRFAAEAWLKEKNLWKTRQQWLDAAQPHLSPETTPATVVNWLQTYSKDKGVTVKNQDLVTVPSTDAYEAHGIHLQLSSSLQSMVRWLHDLQKPGAFINCQQFVCRAGEKPGEMDWEITLARFYTPSSTPSKP
ncbi:MAG: hypothetical protein PHV34_07835 [Verrucomicrobiae bacterium]|nr:hypothetical protein [Verrucomicrobiae bacterium]